MTNVICTVLIIDDRDADSCHATVLKTIISTHRLVPGVPSTPEAASSCPGPTLEATPHIVSKSPQKLSHRTAAYFIFHCYLFAPLKFPVPHSFIFQLPAKIHATRQSNTSQTIRNSMTSSTETRQCRRPDRKILITIDTDRLTGLLYVEPKTRSGQPDALIWPLLGAG
jgi:hypothetical protein